jgi:hypothetical protein
VRIAIDITTVPPRATLLDADDFERFDVVITNAEHAFIAPDCLRRLAGERAADPEWTERLERMLEYARSHGWTGDDGSIRAHIEWAP